MSITSEIGIMQGRLSPKIDGKIQAFPVENWKSEFQLARQIGFSSIEWIVEKPLELNPLLNEVGINDIKKIIEKTGIKVEFICADIFMQEPIKNEKLILDKSRDLILRIIENGYKIGAKYIEIPFVDNSSIRNIDTHYLLSFFNSFEEELANKDMFINLETDLNHLEFKSLLSKLNFRIGANYDIGNSASLGYDFENEIDSYGERINNVHIKDRKLGGSTVEFGTGNADIEKVLSKLSQINYQEGIIIQGARGENDFEVAKKQYEFTNKITNKLNYVK